MSNSRNLAKPKQPLSFFSKLFLAFAVVCSFAGDACAGRIAEKTGWNISAEEEKTVEKMPLPSGKLTDSMGTCQTATRISTSDEFKKEYQSRPVYFGHLWIWAQYHFGERARSKSDCRDQEFVIRAWQSALGLPITGVFGLKEAEAYLNYCPACDIRAQRENLKKLQFFGMNFGFKPEMPTCSEERGKYGYIESKGEFPCIENHVPLEGFRRDMSSATITTRVEFGNKRPGFLFSTLLVDLVDGQLEKMHFSLRRDYLEEIKAILRERLGKETVASNITEGVYRNHAESEFNFRREDIQATINCLSISSVCEVDVFSDRWINHQKKSVRSKIKEGVEF